MMAFKSCNPSAKFREEEEENEEVPQNFIPQTPIQRPPRHVEKRWSIQSAPPPPVPLPTYKASEEFNWQANQRTIRQRNAVMFNNPLMADVFFTVGQAPNTQKIPAHKYILAIGSSVFFAMFYGGLSDGQKEVDLPDVEPAALLNVLRYLYTDEIQLETDNVLPTLYAAKKYLIPHLAKACVMFLETSLSAKNACILLSQGRLFEEQELMNRCWEVIDAQAEEALNSDNFVEIDYNTLETILKRESLNVREVLVFKAACRWAKAECGRQGITISPENQRLVLQDAVYSIRIPSMPIKEFANNVAQSNILTLKETNEIFLNYTASKKPLLNFNAHSRRGLAPFRCHRFQSSAYRSNQWRYRGRCDSIQFCVDKRVFVTGFGLYGSSNGAAEYQVKTELKKNGAIMGHCDTKFFSDGSSNTFPVYFQNPIQIEPDIYYTASVILEGSELSYFGQEGLAEVTCGKVTFQFQCSSDSTNGTGVQGGQIPELIFYC